MENCIMKHKSLILSIAIVLHIICAWNSSAYIHPDEHFQILEFANYKLGHTSASNLAWEFEAKMRPGLQPFIAYVIIKSSNLTGIDNPNHIAFLLRLLSSVLAFFVSIHLFRSLSSKVFTQVQNANLYLSFLCWSLVFLHVRFSSENWSAMFFTLAVSFVIRNHKHRYFLFGVLSALSLLFRFQAIFFIAGAGLWFLFIDKSNFRSLLICFFGFTLLFLVGVLFDYWLYGEWVCTFWNYLYQNMFLGKAASFCVEPWYWYFKQLFEQAIPPYSLLLLIGFFSLLYKQPKSIITWTSFMFLIGHLLVAHKELRFLFPLSYFVPFFVLTGIDYIRGVSSSNSYQNVLNYCGKSFLVINPIMLLLICIKPANEIGDLFNRLSSIKTEKTLLYLDKSPYKLTPQEASFYVNDKLNIFQTDSFLSQSNTNFSDTALLYSEDLNFQSIEGFEVIGKSWTNTPDWLRKLNFNNWLDRRNNYTLFLVTKKNKIN
jgi:phosphatidylinositol glycan class B